MANSVDDVVIENSTVANTAVAVNTKGDTLGANVVVRGLKLTNVPTLINGPGATLFTVLP